MIPGTTEEPEDDGDPSDYDTVVGDDGDIDLGDYIDEEGDSPSATDFDEVTDDGYTEHELMSDLSVKTEETSQLRIPDVSNDVKVTSWVNELIEKGGYYIWSPNTGAIMWYRTWGQAKAAVQRAPIGAVIITVRDGRAYTYGKMDVGYSSAGTETTRHWVQRQVDEATQVPESNPEPPQPAPSPEEPVPEQEKEQGTEESETDSGSGESDDDTNQSRTENSVDSDYLSGPTDAEDSDGDGYDDNTGEGLGYEDVPDELTVDDLDDLF